LYKKKLKEQSEQREKLIKKGEMTQYSYQAVSCNQLNEKTYMTE
jgi:hypothetical protein